jgi:hypothetical protein
MSEKLYVSLGKAKTLEIIPLAFTIADDLPPVTVDGFTLSWTKEALANFSKILQDIKKIKNLPYASLRGFLEVKLLNVSRIEPNMGLSNYTVSQQQQQPFAYIDGGDRNKIIEDLRSILNDWLENYLIPYGQKEGVSEDAMEKLRELQEENQLLCIKSFQSQIFPWLQYEDSGTAKPGQYSFSALADYLARLIAEHEIFQGLGDIKRIITSKSGSCVELITNPISLDDKGLFSLLVKIEIITHSSLPQPLIKIDVSKRRWLSSLKENRFNPNGINGYIFSKNHSDRVFNFKLNRRKNLNINQWEWQPDSSFLVLQRELNLPLNISNAEQIVKSKASADDDYQILLTYSEGIQEKKHDIKAGVSEKDTLEAFRAIAEVLESKEIKPFDGYTKVQFSKEKGHSQDISASRTINTPTSFSAILESLENEDTPESEKKSLEAMSDREINNLLKENFNFELSEKSIKHLNFNSKNKDQTEELKKLFKANQDAIERLYSNEKPLLIIFYENGYRKTGDLLEAVIYMLWGEKLEIQIQNLPENTHGAKTTLPGKDLKSKARAQKQVDDWTSTAKQIAAYKRKTF